jgi:hypothetical protein
LRHDAEILNNWTSKFQGNILSSRVKMCSWTWGQSCALKFQERITNYFRGELTTCLLSFPHCPCELPFSFHFSPYIVTGPLKK